MYFYLVFGVCGLLLLIRFITVIYSAAASPLRPIPGPFLARFTKLWYFWRMNAGEFEHENIALHREHGKNGPETRLTGIAEP